jgi:uncharacterized protein (DUF983 family)
MSLASPLSATQNSVSARDTWQAIKRGFIGRCPNCGKGPIFGRYLKVNPECPVCHEQLHHHRADDAPPYFTMMVVGHVVIAGLLAVEEYDASLPIWFHAILWPFVVLAMSLALLPRIKGALIGYQWALRMHGFGHVEAEAQDGRRIGGPTAA